MNPLSSPPAPGPASTSSTCSRARWRKYRTVALVSWQDSLVYRFNALTWVAYALLMQIKYLLALSAFWLAEVGGLLAYEAYGG